jgi:hypothetical protein
MFSFLMIACKDSNSDPVVEDLSVTFNNAPITTPLQFPDQDSLDISGIAKSSSGLTKILYYRVEGTTAILTDELALNGDQQYLFSKKVSITPTTKAIRIVCFDAANKNISVDYSVSVVFASWTSTLGTAFSNAEGGGTSTTGGRFGRILYVTNLTDNNAEGSLRWAVSQTGKRMIVFAKSGTIQLGSPLEITAGDVTIAGQTAPGDGICVSNYPVRIKANNVILQFMRFRMGDVTKTQDDALGCIGYSNILIDHCSMSWSTDECGSFYKNTNFTLQWCILAESLTNSIHAKGAHGYGGIWGGQNASFHHNLLADHDSRNPRFDHDCISSVRGPIDFVNNVVYNWGNNGSYGGENRTVNIVNNYYKPGAATSNKSLIFNPAGYGAYGFCYDSNKAVNEINTDGRYYISGNTVEGDASATADNWGVGVQVKGGDAVTSKAIFRVNTPFAVTSINAQAATDAYTSVVNHAGASLKRDAVDIRIINQVQTGTYLNEGSNGSTGGLIDSQKDVGGWPALSTSKAPVDTDNDGMPDVWEDTNGLNKYNGSDRNKNTLDSKRTNIEVYLSSLVSNLY